VLLKRRVGRRRQPRFQESPQNEYDEAIAKFQKTIELNPKYADAYHNLGTALQRQNKYEEAEKQFAKERELLERELFNR
jgi:tetratricopeptide (TPR) repeat protein